MVLNQWKLERKELPDDDIKVIVIAPDGSEVVMFRKGRLWFFDDGGMYVYWTPIFWRELKGGA